MTVKNKVILALGSNIGNREENIFQALSKLKKLDIQLINHSNLYETEPVGFEDQNYFYNILLCIETAYEPVFLLKEVKRIEYLMGRRENIKNGPRIIDIDILLFNDIIIDSDELMIPHKEIANRYFIMHMLDEIESDMIIPKTDKSVKEILKNMEKTKKIKRIPLGKIKEVL